MRVGKRPFSLHEQKCLLYFSPWFPNDLITFVYRWCLFTRWVEMLLPFPCLFGPCLVFHSHDLFHVYCFLISEFLKYFWELIMINKCYIYDSASQAFRAHPGHTHLPNAISPVNSNPQALKWAGRNSSHHVAQSVPIPNTTESFYSGFWKSALGREHHQYKTEEKWERKTL